jgi:glycosyltransferase involved in cell wall biosynthesis
VPDGPEVAFVHDHLVQRGGSERVLVSMLRAFPGAPVYTAFYRADATYAELAAADIRPLAVDRVPGLRRRHRAAFPLLRWAFSHLEVPADVVVCSSSGWAHGARTRGRKVVYFHALAQWLHTPPQYAAGSSTTRAAALAAARRLLVGWDRAGVRGADCRLVSGPTMRRRLADVYGVDAEILPPPLTFDPLGEEQAVTGLAAGFFLCAARLMPYKNVDAAVSAFAALPDERLVVAGAGPEEQRLRAMAPANVTFVGPADDSRLRWLYANCRAVISPGFESYGLTPVEAAAFAKPTVALREGGSVDVVAEGRTGELFDQAHPGAVADAIRRLLDARYDDAAFRDVVARHDEAAFMAGLRAVVEREGRADAVARRQ